MKGNTQLWDYLAARLSPNGLAFLSRIYSDGLSKYKQRLVSLGFSDRRSVLDAGCGMGQWTMALAGMNKSVHGLDVSSDRIEVARVITASVGLQNIKYSVGQLEKLQFADSYFDGIFCYSVLYLTDFERALREFSRVLKAGGILYICSNALGRFLYEVIKCPNPTEDFNPRRYGLLTLRNTLLRKRTGLSSATGGVATSRRRTCRVLENLGFEILGAGPEGSVGEPGRSFHRAKYLGLENVFEVLACREKIDLSGDHSSCASI
jgi:SAM-dependent methyltransferase